LRNQQRKRDAKPGQAGPTGGFPRLASYLAFARYFIFFYREMILDRRGGWFRAIAVTRNRAGNPVEDRALTERRGNLGKAPV